MRKEIKIGIIVGVIIAVSAVIFLLSQSASEPMAIPDTANFSNSTTKTVAKEPQSVKQPVNVSAPVNKVNTPVAQPAVVSPALSNSSELTKTADKAGAGSVTQTGVQPTSQSVTNTTVKAENNIVAPTNIAVRTPEVQTPEVKPVLSPTKAGEPTVYHQQMNEPRFHVVKKGDSLSSISVKYFGSAKYWQSIYNANKNIVTNASSLRIGWKLRIPSPEEVE
ncbi:MAG: LysM peptidoglycan-binding domain-containing protein [Sedimentisphaerales bacterium]|nr:LysM peptidoglycan-binding domain-containing protein [Sedimentisphaerales bacterium]